MISSSVSSAIVKICILKIVLKSVSKGKKIYQNYTMSAYARPKAENQTKISHTVGKGFLKTVK